MCVADRPAVAATWRSVSARSRRTVRMRRPISPLRMRTPLERVFRAGGHEHDAGLVAQALVGMGPRRLEVQRVALGEHVFLLAHDHAQRTLENVQELLALVPTRTH